MSGPRSDGVILAIDPSGRGTGIAEGKPGDKPILETAIFANDDMDGPTEIFGRAAAYFTRRLTLTSAHVLAIETPLVVHNALIVVGIYGIIVGLARAHGMFVMPVTINTWRKFALGSGRLDGQTAKREAMKLCKQLKWQAVDHNSAEAACIFLWASSQRAPKIAQRPEPLFTVDIGEATS